METKYRIFIVDDDRFNLLLVSRKLKQALNCSTRLFQNARECMDAIEYDRPDLVVTDFRLDDQSDRKMNGDYLLNWFREKRADIPVIMYSSMARFELVLKMIRDGAVDFIPRDENFLQKLARIVTYQTTRLKDVAAEKKTRRIVLLTVTAITAIMLYLGFAHQELLVPFAVSMLVIFAMIVFFKDILKRNVYW